MAYMTSIVDQFEFVTKSWVNNPRFKDPDAGRLFRSSAKVQGPDGSRERSFDVRINGRDTTLTAQDDWVIPTGGGYYFAPSISAIRDVLAQSSRETA
jgi:hypothetical protein